VTQTGDNKNEPVIFKHTNLKIKKKKQTKESNKKKIHLEKTEAMGKINFRWKRTKGKGGKSTYVTRELTNDAGNGPAAAAAGGDGVAAAGGHEVFIADVVVVAIAVVVVDVGTLVGAVVVGVDDVDTLVSAVVVGVAVDNGVVDEPENVGIAATVEGVSTVATGEVTTGVAARDAGLVANNTCCNTWEKQHV
jgi:hypothetical protein